MLTRVEYRNNKDLLFGVTPAKPKTFVFTLNKISVILKCILTKTLKLYLNILENDVL